MTTNEIEIVPVIVRRETEKAYLLEDGEYPERQDYFPKSQVSFKSKKPAPEESLAEIPTWLLNAKGWV